MFVLDVESLNLRNCCRPLSIIMSKPENTQSKGEELNLGFDLWSCPSNDYEGTTIVTTLNCLTNFKPNHMSVVFP